MHAAVRPPCTPAGHYGGHEAGFHWATHFLVGLTVAALFNLVWQLARDAPASGQIPHYRWMDVFLGHISAHEIPGGDTVWLAIGVASLTAYAAALSAWLRAGPAR